MFNLLNLFFLLINFNNFVNGDYVIGCYYTNWSQHRKEEVKFLPINIDPTLCTHAYFAFANIDLDSLALATFEKNDITDSPEKPVYSF